MRVLELCRQRVGTFHDRQMTMGDRMQDGRSDLSAVARRAKAEAISITFVPHDEMMAIAALHPSYQRKSLQTAKRRRTFVRRRLLIDVSPIDVSAD
ncbi:hypothetical protein JQ604_17200 [Bradyrhizobium jicamae]|uniref:hypothetical protein n=1 Tax=Bradyrhizobium jicamae TaxID=280332 RepID=UPI001BA5E584|nr:hypothetical protein [Bradyrhizobium jicamae]MBR0753924.1 hypothetical protein [Bradyrhizobium jicamae]